MPSMRIVGTSHCVDEWGLAQAHFKGSQSRQGKPVHLPGNIRYALKDRCDW